MPGSDLLFQALIILIPAAIGAALYFIAGMVMNVRFLNKTLSESMVPVLAGAISFGVTFGLMMLLRLFFLNR